MKILVAIKRVVDYNVKVHVLPDGTGLDIADAHRSMNPFDEIAVEAAVRSRSIQTRRLRLLRCRIEDYKRYTLRK